LLVQNVSKITSDLGYFIAFMFQLMFEALNLKVKSGKSVNRLCSKSIDGAQKGSAARNVTETKFIWKNRKLKRPYKPSFLIQMALKVEPS
jgi:hypothetical protein